MKYALFLSLKQSCAYGKEIDIIYHYDSIWFMVRDIAYIYIHVYIYIYVMCDIFYVEKMRCAAIPRVRSTRPFA